MPILILLSAFAPIAVMIALIVLGELSGRLGSVLKTDAIHRGFYIAAALAFISVLTRLLSIGLPDKDFRTDGGDTLFSLLYIVPLTISVMLGLVTAWRYWGWLIYASDGKMLTPPRRK